jgi:hypothetical protein
VDAAFMSFHVHGRGIHIVCSARRPGTSSHGTAPQTLPHHRYRHAWGKPVHDQEKLSSIELRGT